MSYFVSNSASTVAYTPAGDTAFTTNRFWATMRAIQRQRDFELELTGRAITVPLFPNVHGETGCTDDNYGADLIGWQASMEAETKAITGQSGKIPFLISQQIACTNLPSNSNMLWLHLNHRDEFTLAGPKYQFQRYSIDGTHFTNYDQQGELLGKAAEAMIRSGWFEPLRPVAASRSTATITVTMTNYGNFGMVLDSNTIPFVANLGVGYLDDSGSTPTITSVALSGANTNQIVIVLSGTPTGNKRVTFGYPIAGMVSSGGWTNRPRTNIRNACTNIGIASGLNVWDWAVQGEIAVN